MSSAAANKTKLEKAYRDWHDSRGKSVEELIAVFDDDDVRFGSLGQGAESVPFTAPRVGKEHMRGYFTGLLANWTMNHYTIHYMIAEGDRVAVIGSTSWTCKATRNSVETPKVDIWTFKDGRAVEFYEYFDTARVFAAATPA
jgi:ketosteroid isomerase-like protein